MKRILCGIIISNLFPFSCAHAHNHSTVLTNQQAPQHLLQKKKNKAPKSRANATENFILPASNHLAVTHDISERNITPRKVMLVFHNKEGGDKYGEDSATFRYFGMPLEYLGYVPVLTNISKKMSTAEKNQPLAGIIVLEDAMPKDYSRQFLSWLAQ